MTKKQINPMAIRFTEEEHIMINELVNSYADFSFKKPAKSDIVREAIRVLYKREIPESSRQIKVD